jgi:hypothetical protein
MLPKKLRCGASAVWPVRVEALVRGVRRDVVVAVVRVRVPPEVLGVRATLAA